ncbi:hypothetical protein BDZ97DRAFT_2062413 [Flammula alnicola]|nr:hypothetical protein BDZ97DRAFT_2062413 [Flammula alnicola]
MSKGVVESVNQSFTTHPNPVIKIFDIEQLLRSIDDDGASAKLDPNYDESDDEEDGDLSRMLTDDVPSSTGPITISHTLPAEGDDEDIDMASVELEEILADGPVVRKVAKAAFLSQKVMAGSEESSAFELPSWYSDEKPVVVALLDLLDAAVLQLLLPRRSRAF